MSHSENRPDNLPRELDAWVSSRDEKVATSVSTLWHMLEHVPDRSPVPDSARLERIRQKVLIESRSTANILQFNTPKYRYVFGIAASIVLVLAGYWLFQRPSEKVFETGSESGRIVKLVDGTIVTLHAESSLSVDESYGKANRLVLLDGEAMFDVEKGDISFEVVTFNARVTVLGTVFNVRARESDLAPETFVVVEEGSVSLASTDNSEQKVILQHGESAHLAVSHSTSTAPITSRGSRAGSWQTGRIEFENMAISDIASELNRRYSTTITVADSIKTRKFSLYLGPRSSIESVLDDLCASAELRYQETSSGYLIYQ